MERLENSQCNCELGLVNLKEPEREINSQNNEVGGFGVAFATTGASDSMKLLRSASIKRDWLLRCRIRYSIGDT
ncbi:hypothetical protein FCV25MIE_14449, partial [Fagus crenata]